MNLASRRATYLAFFAIFFAITPVLILYSTGFRYNFKKNSLEKTGIMVIESTPPRADVTIDGDENKKTPARYNRLFPSTYDVVVSKDGYHPWKKSVQVQSNLTTFHKDIVLFRQALPTLQVAGEVAFVGQSPDQEKIVYSLTKDDIQEIRLYQPKLNSDTLLLTIPLASQPQLELISFAPGGEKILLRQSSETETDYRVINIVSLTVQEVPTPADVTFTNVKWDQTSDLALFAQDATTLYRVDLIQKITMPVVATTVVDFLGIGNQLYYITNTTTGSLLQTTALETETEQTIKLPPNSAYRFTPAPNDRLALIDTIHEELFIVARSIFDTQNINDAIILQGKARSITWSQNNGKLLYFTDFELWSFDIATRQSNLITRTSKPLTQALWLPNHDYIIYQADNELHATELDQRGGRNDITLTSLNEIRPMAIDQSGEFLYFSAVVGNQRGLFELQLQ